MTATTRSAHRPTTPIAPEDVEDETVARIEKQTSPASTESSQDDVENKERPVRRKLKKASIAGPESIVDHDSQAEKADEVAPIATKPNGSFESHKTNGVEPRGRVRRKRSFEEAGHDESQEQATRNASKHIRKRSRESSKSRKVTQEISEEPLTEGITPDDFVPAMNGGSTETNTPVEEEEVPQAGAINGTTTDEFEAPNTTIPAVDEGSVLKPSIPADAADSVIAPTSPGVKRSLDEFVADEDRPAGEAKVEVPTSLIDDVSSVVDETDAEPQSQLQQADPDLDKESVVEAAQPKVAKSPHPPSTC